MPLPPNFSYHTPDEEPPTEPTVLGNGDYELAKVAPGLFELRPRPTEPALGVPPDQEPTPPAIDAEAPVCTEEDVLPSPETETKLEDLPTPQPLEDVHQEEEPSREDEEEMSLAPPPPRPIPVLAVNTGLVLAAGETAAVTPEHLRLTGGEAHLLDVMILSPPLHGVLLRDGFALTGGDAFTQEDIDQNRLAYRHEGGPEGSDSFTFATPEGEVPATLFPLTIEPLRRAPQLAGNGELAAAPDGWRVEDVLDGTASCCEPDLTAGVAVVGVAGRGQWQYSLDAGATWLDLSEPHHTRALLLGERDVLRFVPRPGWSGPIKLTYHAWDQSTGQAGAVVNLSARNAVGGSTAFSKATACAAGNVVAPAAPERQPDPTIDPWTAAPTLGELVGGALAVVRLEGQGTWQFSLDDGRTWSDFGPVYHGRARLLRAGDRVRFLPRRDGAGKVALAGRPWDGRGAGSGETLSLAAKRSYGEGTPFADSVRTRTWRLSER
jgi:hypothetical protein